MQIAKNPIKIEGTFRALALVELAIRISTVVFTGYLPFFAFAAPPPFSQTLPDRSEIESVHVLALHKGDILFTYDQFEGWVLPGRPLEGAGSLLAARTEFASQTGLELRALYPIVIETPATLSQNDEDPYLRRKKYQVYFISKIKSLDSKSGDGLNRQRMLFPAKIAKRYSAWASKNHELFHQLLTLSEILYAIDLDKKNLKEIYEQTQSLQSKFWELSESLIIPWKKTHVTDGLDHYTFQGSFFRSQQNIHVVEYSQNKNSKLSLSVVKLSNELNSNEAVMQQQIALLRFERPGARFMLNGGFYHYSRKLYSWSTLFNYGDPVGLNKIADQVWHDLPEGASLERFGFLIQKGEGNAFQIVDHEGVQDNLDSKYILSGSPILINDSKMVSLNEFNAYPTPSGEIGAPGGLGHLFNVNPRTVVGIKSNGNLLFVTVDGRRAVAGGMTVNELSALMHHLGAETAINLDGGGSTSMYLRETQKRLGGIVNLLSPDAPNRQIGNAIVLCDESLLELNN